MPYRELVCRWEPHTLQSFFERGSSVPIILEILRIRHEKYSGGGFSYFLNFMRTWVLWAFFMLL